MKKHLIALCMIPAAFMAKAQTASEPSVSIPVGDIEVEWQVLGITAPFGKDAEGGYDSGLQIRENIQGTPWSYGACIGLYLPFRKRPYYTTPDHNEYYYGESDCIGGMYAGIVGEYALKRGSHFSPYVNASTGLLWGGSDNHMFRPYIRPAIGIEVLNHVRLGISSTLTTEGGSGMSVNISIVFGGCPKK